MPEKLNLMILIELPGYEFSSDEDELQDDPLHRENAVDNSKPRSIQPILPAATLFFFASFMRRSGGNTTKLFCVMREADALLPHGPLVV